MRYMHVRTERLRLDAVSPGDLDEVHELHADPEVWRHLPSGRHDSRAGTAAFIAQIEGDWAAEGLGYWAVRHGGRPGAGPASGAFSECAAAPCATTRYGICTTASPPLAGDLIQTLTRHT